MPPALHPASQAGVDIDAGDELVNRIKRMNPAMNTGFSGYVPFGDSLLVSGTDGVGTKLKLAFDMNKHDTVGSKGRGLVSRRAWDRRREACLHGTPKCLVQAAHGHTAPVASAGHAHMGWSAC